MICAAAAFQASAGLTPFASTDSSACDSASFATPSLGPRICTGAASAEAMRQRGLIQGARLALQGQVRRVGLESPEKGFKAAP